MIFSEGWPAGIHHGKIGANPAANTNVSILRLTQPFIFPTARAFLTFCPTRKSQVSSTTSNGTHPYMDRLRSTQLHAGQNPWSGGRAARVASRHHAPKAVNS